MMAVLLNTKTLLVCFRNISLLSWMVMMKSMQHFQANDDEAEGLKTQYV